MEGTVTQAISARGFAVPVTGNNRVRRTLLHTRSNPHMAAFLTELSDISHDPARTLPIPSAP